MAPCSESTIISSPSGIFCVTNDDHSYSTIKCNRNIFDVPREEISQSNNLVNEGICALLDENIIVTPNSVNDQK